MELWGSDYLNISSNWRWFSTAPNATFRTDTSIFQQSIWYGLERKITASHVRHWHSFNIHLIQSFFNNRRARVQLFNVFQFQSMFYSRFTARFHSCPFTLPVLYQQFSFLAQRWSSGSSLCWGRLNPHYSMWERRCWNHCPVSSKFRSDLDPGMEIKFELWQKWGLRHHLSNVWSHSKWPLVF